MYENINKLILLKHPELKKLKIVDTYYSNVTNAYYVIFSDNTEIRISLISLINDVLGLTLNKKK